MILRSLRRHPVLLLLLLGAGAAGALGHGAGRAAGTGGAASPTSATDRAGRDGGRLATSASTRVGRRAGARTDDRVAGLVLVTGTVRTGSGTAATTVGDVEVVFSGDHGVASAIAAADGSYRIELQPGRYRVSAQGDGVMSVVRAERSRLPGGPSWDQVEAAVGFAPAIDLRRDAAGVDVQVVRGGAITGRVVDGAGRPVVGAVVRARSYASELRPALGTDLGVTDGAGNYRLEVPEGSYVLDASDEATGATARDDVGTVEVASGAPATADLTMILGCTITGTVVAPDGVPVTGGGLDQGEPGSDSFWMTGHIEDDGSFRWSAPVDGPIALRAWPWMSAPTAGQTFACRPGARFDGVVFQVPDVAPDLDGAILYADGTPAAGAYVEINARSAGGQSQQERADDAGTFGVFTMPPGEYEISVVTARGAATRMVTVPAHGVQIALATGALAGQVTGVVDGSFNLRYACTQSGFGGRELLVAVRGGRYQVDDLPGCDMGIQVETASRTASAAVTIAAGQTAIADLDLTPPRIKTVIGTVIGADGTPAASATVSAGDDHEVTTDARGQFRIEVESGSTLWASADGAGGSGEVSYRDVASETIEITLTAEGECDDCECDDCEGEGEYDGEGDYPAAGSYHDDGED